MQTSEFDPAVLQKLGGGEHAEERSGTLAGAMPGLAARRGLLDVAYGFADSPFGRLLVAMTPEGLVRLAYPTEDFDQVLQSLATRVSPRVLESGRRTDPLRRQLDQYFEGRRRRFQVAVDLSLARGFQRKVLDRTASIPLGTVATYGEVAAAIGSPLASRATGNALGANPVPIVVPCHRVVHSDGTLGGYGGGREVKVALLQLEGVLDVPADHRHGRVPGPRVALHRG
jgi:methylated-DNA-[protein]-cysteine S-methyltransferase